MKLLDKFNYQIYGSEGLPRVVLLHGLMGSGINWRKITSQLEGRYQILTYDQRGHGKSFHPLSGYAPVDFAQDLVEILDDLKWEKVHLLGHSMGGRAVIEFAARQPEKLFSLVVEDIGIYPSEAGAGNVKRLLDLVPRPFASKRDARDFLINRFPTLIPDNPNGKILGNYFYTNIEEKPDGTADWRFSLPGILESLVIGRQWSGVEAWKNLKVPTLLVRGENSTDLSKEEFLDMSQSLEGVKAITINDAGHWVHFDQPEIFCQEVDHFWQSVAYSS